MSVGRPMLLQPLRLFLAGDVMTGRGVDQVLPHPGEASLREPYVTSALDYVRLAERAHGPVPAPVEPASIWGDALAVLEAARPAARLVNLETSITTAGAFWPGKAVHYRMHPANIACLTVAGLDVCAMANNHVLDFGHDGLAETLQTLRHAGIRVAGAGADAAEAARPAEVPLGAGTRLIVYAVGAPSSGIPLEWAAAPGQPGVWLAERISAEAGAALAARIVADKGPGDVVAVSIHWGGNWGWEVSGAQVAFAHALVDGGVDLVHGHSSHHVRPVEVYQGRLILYGCGDLITDYEGISGHEEWRGDLGALYLADLAAADGTLTGLRLVPTQMRRLRLKRAGAADAAWLGETLNRISRTFGSRFRQKASGALELVLD